MSATSCLETARKLRGPASLNHAKRVQLVAVEIAKIAGVKSAVAPRSGRTLVFAAKFQRLGMETDTFIAWAVSQDKPALSIIKPADGDEACVGNGTMVADTR